MATGTANSTSPPPITGSGATVADQVGGYGATVERQLRQTQRQVKFVDLCTASMVLVAGMVGFWLFVAVVDHWILGLDFWGRLVSLVALLAGSGGYFFRVVLPLMIHRINPLYAARSIEQGTPALKNSLINFLMFRSNQTAVHRVVYQAMEQKAATDLASVPVDTAVDRSKMIKMGYILAAVLAVGAAYTILSPKDPFQTLARVVAPWQNIARPSRVVIDDVQPGSVEVVRGQFVDVTARIRGVRVGKENVSVIYSSKDGQTVEQAVTMELDDNQLAYHARLPVATAGLQQDLEYRIESGDAVSATFAVTLAPVPSILVDTVEYEYPRYTNQAPASIRHEGDIRAIEGTRVTVKATANKPIRSATITFNPQAAPDAARPRHEVAMTVSDSTLQHTFTLALTGDRRTPLYNSYQLSFVSESGQVSGQPTLHQIDVFPDLAPEVEILDPVQNRITIPVSGQRKIEVRAVDPDFGLSRLALRAVSGGTDVLDKVLFEDTVGRRGQAIVAYDFAPSRLGLVANDKVTFWAVAEDNQQPYSVGQAGAGQIDASRTSPNVTRTRHYQIEIIPDPAKPASQPGERSAGDEGAPGETGDRPRPDSDPADAEETPPENNDPESSSDPGESPETAGDQDKSEQDDQKQESQEGAGGQSGGAANSPEGEAQEGGGGAGAPQTGQSQSGDAGSSGGSGGNTPQSGGDEQGAADGQAGDAPPKQLHDGEVIEKVMRKLMEERARGEGRPDPDGNQDGTPPGNNSNDPGEGEPSDKPSGNADDQSKPQGDATGQSQGSDTDSQPFSEDGQPKPNQQDSKSGDGAQQPDRKRGAGDQKAGNPGEGGDTNDTSAEQQGKTKPDTPGEPDTREKEPGSGDNGESGAGQNSQDTEGSGSVESSQDQTVNNRDKPKNRNPDSTEPQEKSDPGSTNSKKQSDSEGGQSGDQSGGGQKGPGQGANQAGNDSAGQNSSADDGAGASSEAGDGESSDAAGSKQEAPGKTGSRSNKKGDGASTRKDPNGNKDDPGTAGSSPDALPSQENRNPQDQQKGGGGGNRQGDNGLPTGGGVPSDVRHNSGIDPDLDVSAGDAANLEYSRRATDMVIDYLKDQESRPNPELLKELGWTPEEMKQFIARWERLKRGAAAGPGSRELDESLRSLGLRSPQNKTRKRQIKSDSLRGLNESGDVSQPPAAYRDLFDAFKKGAARVRE